MKRNEAFTETAKTQRLYDIVFTNRRGEKQRIRNLTDREIAVIANKEKPEDLKIMEGRRTPNEMFNGADYDRRYSSGNLTKEEMECA